MFPKGPINFQELGAEIWRRTKTPLSDGTFLFFLSVGVVVFGGMGIWIEIGRQVFSRYTYGWDGAFNALTVFYPALIGAASLQLALEAVRKSTAPLFVFSIGILLVMIALAVLIGISQYQRMFPGFVFWGTLALCLIALWMVCVANCDNPDLTTDPRAATGGDTNRPLPGDLSEYEVG